MLCKLVASGCYNIPWTCTHVWCYANVHTCLMLRKLVASGCEMSWLWNGSIVEMSWLWSSKRRKKTEIEDSELTSQQRSRPYCMVIINDFGVTIGNRLEIVLFFWNKHHQNCANEQLQLGRNWCGTRSVSNPAGCFYIMVKYGKCRQIYHTWILWDIR